MLHLHLSNRTEVLFDALCGVLAQPIANVFQPEIIVVEGGGMARWLSQQLAMRQGIAANIDFPLPAGFMWRVLHGQLQTGLPAAGFSKNTLLWYSMALLPSLKERPGFEPIRRYLSGSEAESKTYQLSRQIADLFDQYLVYRPDVILRWEAGEGQHWQARLWRAMRKQSNEPHWAALMADFKASLDTQDFKGSGLPERVSLFALSTLSPGYIELLALLAHHIDVHLYVINPSVNYWGDILSEQDLARLRDAWRKSGRPDVSDLYTVGNPLLASMGKPSRDFLDLWHDHAPNEHEAFEAPGDDRLLSLIQGDILHLQARGGGELPACICPLDDSIQVHACHSPMREVQVLHDRLLSLFDSRPDLKPHEIVVMAPDIAQYSAYIESVFGAAPPERFIPYSVAALPLIQQPLLETLLTWLKLPEERFEAPAVMGWLEIPAVQAKLGLDPESVERIRQWIRDSGIRWGLDARHKEELGLPANEHNTWAFGFNRLFLGYAMPAGVDLFHGVAPLNAIEGGEAVWLGQLREFIAQLTRWRMELASPTTLPKWQARINRLVDQFFQPDQDEAVYLDNLREQVAHLVSSAETAGFTDSVSATIMHQLLSNTLASAGSSHRLFAGRVTFCNMVSARSIPFRVVCLLGMNDDSFPRKQRPLGFDLIAQDPRKGDRSLRDDDRYLFLESLLSTREILHISYVGRSQQDNRERLASVVVTELLDYIEQAYRLPEGELREALLMEHPLQPFSQRNFDAGSYAGEWLERESALTGFSTVPLPYVGANATRQSMTLEELQRFLTNPSRYFLEQSLGIHSAEYEEALAKSERFEIDSLAAYSIKDEILADLVSEKEREAHYDIFLARGELPHGGLGRYHFDTTVDGLSDFATVVKQHLAGSVATIDIDIEVAGWRLTGRLSNVIDGRLVRYRATDLKSKDRLALWIAHLARCASGNQGESLHLGFDDSFTITPVEVGEAQGHLERLVTFYQQGSRSPLPLFMNASVAYVKRFLKDGNTEAALMAAKAKWESTEYSRGDTEDPWIAQAFRDSDPFDERFEEVSLAVWEPIIGQSA